MKKNAVGHVLAHKEPVGRKISSLHLPAWFLCLFLALVIWLSVANLNTASDHEEKLPETELTGESV
ncbi:MAG: hypothetical protein IJX80_08890 [Clostridia bacterium]|nr:hypothetical protein [Clostridia bacterium]